MIVEQPILARFAAGGLGGAMRVQPSPSSPMLRSRFVPAEQTGGCRPSDRGYRRQRSHRPSQRFTVGVSRVRWYALATLKITSDCVG